MYKNCIFDLYGTLVDIHTNEKKEELWEKLAMLYRYYGADYETEELRTMYAILVKGNRKKQQKQRFPPCTSIPTFLRMSPCQKQIMC